MAQNDALLKSQASSVRNLEMQKDLGSFTVPCSIGGIDAGNALCDLGANINLMPLSVFKKLGSGDVQPTSMMLQLADKTITYPEGKIEDVLVKVDKFIFPTYVIILDYEADRDVPIILRHPFLATGKLLIDVHKGELTMCIDNQEEKFNVLNALKFPYDEQCQPDSPIDLHDEEEMDQVCEVYVLGETIRKFELLSLNERQTKPTRPFLEEPSTLELKPLPHHLKYAILGSKNTLLVII
ncbi:uncharacterized protein LOC120084164 [Benincasa hispida]|uniref:uncharacterized protein LOC120084164 n=1 Tax=Benincasa hispida TaxID=102211 RepID=UPI001901E7C6|nr:uncharacterized protein LOC120084164 [Benincasa hispida]